MKQFEKVEKGLEICTGSTEYEDCITCPYHEDYYPNVCQYAKDKDALALIRQQQARIAELEAEQEPIPPVVEQEMDDVCSCIDDVYRCGKCGCRLYRFAEKNKYCPDCGKAVKWE